MIFRIIPYKTAITYDIRCQKRQRKDSYVTRYSLKRIKIHVFSFNIQFIYKSRINLAIKRTQSCFAFCVPYVYFCCCISASPLPQRIQPHPYEDVKQTEDKSEKMCHMGNSVKRHHAEEQFNHEIKDYENGRRYRDNAENIYDGTGVKHGKQHEKSIDCT